MEQLPPGFAMTLAQDTEAMETFARLSDAERKAILQNVHQVESKAEMQELVAHLKDHRPT